MSPFPYEPPVLRRGTLPGWAWALGVVLGAVAIVLVLVGVQELVAVREAGGLAGAILPW